MLMSHYKSFNVVGVEVFLFEKKSVLDTEKGHYYYYYY